MTDRGSSDGAGGNNSGKLRDRALFALREQEEKDRLEREVRKAARLAEIKAGASAEFTRVTGEELSPEAWTFVSTPETRLDHRRLALGAQHDGMAFVFLTHSAGALSGDLYLGIHDPANKTWRRLGSQLKSLVDLGKELEERS